jgi:SDR family mycofactocin-dependent oxidoreductase
VSTLEGKVAFITGAARGQGRSHAIRFAEAGADIVAIDICKQIDSVEYSMSSPDDLDETVRIVEGLGRRIVASEVDVRDFEAVQKAVDDGIAALGRVDFVSANAGIMPLVGAPSLTPSAWTDSIDVMLSGVYHTIAAVVPSMVERGEGGSIVLTSSTAGLKGVGARSLDGMSPGFFGYVAAKHGVVGLMRIYANALAPYSIRVNSVHPTGVSTPMVVNDEFHQFAIDHKEVADGMHNALPVQMIEARDVSNAVVWLCGEEARYITGVTLPVDAGATNL